MKTIKKRHIYESEVLKSRFIAIVVHLAQFLDYQSVLEDIKTQYPRASHYCYAVKYDHQMALSDDLEPSGTAGKPILSQIEYFAVDHVMLVVVRYFGGRKLGVERLLRTYLSTAKQCLEGAVIVELINGWRTIIRFSYDQIKVVDNTLKKHRAVIENKAFDASVVYQFYATDDLSTVLCNVANSVIIDEHYQTLIENE